MSHRFTAYLSDQEDKALRELAEEEATSVNYVVRCGIRIMLGLEVPKWALRHAAEGDSHEKTR